jgi:L-lactate utilization protein LutB
LCGHCQDVCPVNIPLKELILKSRKTAVSSSAGSGVSDGAGNGVSDASGTPGAPGISGVPGVSESVLDKSRIKTLTKMFLKRKNIEKNVDRFFLRRVFKKAFGSYRIFPNFDKKTFNQIWVESHPINNN